MSYTKTELIKDFENLGIKSGDKILIHASFKAMGEIEGGAKTFFDALKEVLTDEGAIVIPTLSYNPVYQTLEFDLNKTPSCVGWLTEYFRTEVKDVIRSIHPTHSCAVWGKTAEWFTEGHEKDDTPIGENSPFAKLREVGGKILMIGNINNHNTTLHGVEEAGKAPYVFDYSAEPIEYRVTNSLGEAFKMKVRRHNIGQSGFLQQYSRIENLLSERELTYGKLLDADATLMDAKAVWKKGVEKIKSDPYYFVDKI